MRGAKEVRNRNTGMLAALITAGCAGLGSFACRAQLTNTVSPAQPHGVGTEGRAVVGVYDEHSERQVAVYRVPLNSTCEMPDDSVFVRKAFAFLVHASWRLDSFDYENAKLERRGALVRVTFSLGDPEAHVYFNRFGALVFADNTVFAGTGRRMWPTDSLALSVAGETTAPVREPHRSEFWQVPPDAILEQFLRLEALQELATGSYAIGVFLEFYNSAPRASGQWILIAARDPECPEA